MQMRIKKYKHFEKCGCKSVAKRATNYHQLCVY